MRFHILKQVRNMVIIKYNNRTLGKKYVLMSYRYWMLMETYPYDDLSDIHLQGFTLRTITKWHTNNLKTN